MWDSRTSRTRRIAGFTLPELIVALVILAIIYGITMMSIHVRNDTAAHSVLSEVQALRRSALRSGKTSTARIDTLSTKWKEVTSPPDGGVIGDSLPGIDRLSGHPNNLEQWQTP